MSAVTIIVVEGDDEEVANLAGWVDSLMSGSGAFWSTGLMSGVDVARQRGSADAVNMLLHAKLETCLRVLEHQKKERT